MYVNSTRLSFNENENDNITQGPYSYYHCCRHIITSQAGVGWLSWSATETLSLFVERVFAHFRDKNVVFYNCVIIGIFCCNSACDVVRTSNYHVNSKISIA